MLICAGGTGGGMYPAKAVLQAIKTELNNEFSMDEILWLGGESKIDQDLLIRFGVNYQTIPAAGVHGVGLKTLPGNLYQLLRGLFKARGILREFKPDVLFFTGGYLAVPVALAGWSIPSVLFVPDIEPGLALRTIARLADVIALTAEQSRKYFRAKDKLVLTGYPVRSELKSWTRERALEVFQLQSDLSVLLVFGGSKGARSINQALAAVLSELLQDTQVIHITGKLDWDKLQTLPEEIPDKLRERYRIYPYLYHKMGAALSLADLVVSRAGASVLGEFSHFEIPAVLVPYPHAWRYQRINAQYLVDQKAAVMINDQDLNSRLLNTVQELIGEPERLQMMRENMAQAAKPDAAKSLVQLLLKVSGMNQGGTT